MHAPKQACPVSIAPDDGEWGCFKGQGSCRLGVAQCQIMAGPL